MIKFIKNLFKEKTKKEKIEEHFNYLGYLCCIGKITGAEAKEDYKYFVECLNNK